MLYRSKVEPLGQVIDFESSQFDWDLAELSPGQFHILTKEGKSLSAQVLEANYNEKSFRIQVGSSVYELALADRFDLLAESLGFNQLADKKAESVKAPMPGLVQSVLVSPGQAVEKGQPLLILEAMKMENIIKANADATVKSVAVSQGQAVEKNSLLIEWEQ